MLVSPWRMHRIAVLFSSIFVAITFGYICHAKWPFGAIQRYAVAMQILNALFGFTVYTHHLIPSDTHIYNIPIYFLWVIVMIGNTYALSHVVVWFLLNVNVMGNVKVDFTIANTPLFFTAPEIMMLCIFWSVISIINVVVNGFVIFLYPFINKSYR